MTKTLSFAGILLSTLMLTHGFAEGESAQAPAIKLNLSVPSLASETAVPSEAEAFRKSPVVKAVFSPFTGRVKGNKIRVRLQPDLNGHIVKELSKNDYIKVINQEGDYYCVESPDNMKAYVFRSFVIDNVVEGNRVNIRLEPDLEAPVIGHLNSGDHVEGVVSSANKKWLEIAPPASTRFFVAKEFIEKVGGPEYKEKMESRKQSVEQYFDMAKSFAASEMQNAFEEVNFEKIKQGFLTIVHDYADFPKIVESAKEALNKVQDDYLQKRISYLEQKASLVAPTNTTVATTTSTPQGQTQGVQMWEPIEQALYTNWAALNNEKDKEHFYEEQKLASTMISGVLEVYKSPIKNRPGDYIVKNKNLPVAYVYSTKVNLDDYVGKKVNLVCTSRSNHNFAFPAYFVHEVE